MKKLWNYYLFTAVLLSDLSLFAQGEPPPDEDPPAATINSKLILLIISGLFFAIYTFRKNRKAA